MKTEKYLPLGTIVLLKEAKKRMVIIGYEGMTDEEGIKSYDYIGCLYPEGVIALNRNLLFNHDQIEDIFFMGYTDIEDQVFKEELKKIVVERDSKLKEFSENNMNNFVDEENV